MKCVLHSFVAENDLDQDMIYEDFDQVYQMEMEELDLKWQLAMLSLRINRDHAAKSAASVSDAAAEFAMMGISPQVQ
nr:ribonuclease H-like domain, reverse transcriptase, RNA-dependent DNA polymerase [Tanacetum cinerariifolium]